MPFVNNWIHLNMDQYVLEDIKELLLIFLGMMMARGHGGRCPHF